jgi:hypothetical protein
MARRLGNQWLPVGQVVVAFRYYHHDSIGEALTSKQPPLPGPEAVVDAPPLRYKGGIIGRGRRVGRAADHRGPRRLWLLSIG